MSDCFAFVSQWRVTSINNAVADTEQRETLDILPFDFQEDKQNLCPKNRDRLTNALKYLSLRAPEGCVAISMQRSEIASFHSQRRLLSLFLRKRGQVQGSNQSGQRTWSGGCSAGYKPSVRMPWVSWLG